MSDIKVIGGEFEIPLELYKKGTERITERRYSDRYYYTSGRACLYAILNCIADANREYGGVLVPDYICASVTKTIKEAGYDFRFYQIGKDFLPDKKSLCEGLLKERIILLINYFGVSDLRESISLIRRKTEDAVIIIDNVQNYYGFAGKGDFDYMFTSFRKWFPVPDGAEVVAGRKQLYEKLKGFEGRNKFAQYKLAGNILKNFREELEDSVCLELIETGEKILDKGYRCRCTEYSLEVMKKLDKERYAERRKRNAKVLHEGLERIGITNIYREDAVPFFVPILLNNREKVKEKFFENHIFCPIHWPHKSAELQGNNPLYDEEFSLICDQRYGENDMRRILEILESECKNK